MDHGRSEEWLERVPLFRGLSKKQLRRISSISTRLREPAGAVLTREGQEGCEFVVVLEGEIEVRRGDRVVATQGAGSFVGEISLLARRPRTATVVASTPVVIEVIGRSDFKALLDEAPDLATELMQTVAERLAELEEPAAAGG